MKHLWYEVKQVFFGVFGKVLWEQVATCVVLVYEKKREWVCGTSFW